VENLNKVIKEKHIKVKNLNTFDHEREWPPILTELNKLLKEVFIFSFVIKAFFFNYKIS
jgi:hypothetical protein